MGDRHNNGELYLITFIHYYVLKIKLNTHLKKYHIPNMYNDNEPIFFVYYRTGKGNIR